MVNNCPFCNLSSKEVILKNGKSVSVISSNPRLMPGHLLVIIKRHVQKLSELTQEERVELLETLIEFEEKILSKLAPGCDIRQHYHPFLENDEVAVNHFHFHLQPREFKDELWKKTQRFEKSIFQELSTE